MKNILVVFTGGTIGSRTKGSSIDVDTGIGYELLRTYREQFGDEQAAFDCIQPFTLLSENMLPDDWLMLIQAISAHDPSRYDGVIIAHGSDTLAYTAAAVSYAFADVPVPVLLTASNYPPDDPRSEAIRNLAACVSMITHDPLPGVFVVLEDNLGRSIVHLATRIKQSQPFTDQIDSANGCPFGEIIDGRLKLQAVQQNPGVNELRAWKERKQPHIPSFTGDVLYIKPYPGFRYSHIQLAANPPQAVLIELYHSGTTGTRFARPEDTLEQFIELCRQLGVDVYAAPLKDADGKLYATSHALFEYGVIPLDRISVEAALVKLMLAYGTLHEQDAIRQLLRRSLFFEFIEPV